MNEQVLKRLGELARQAPAPKVEVSFRVARQIKEVRVPVDKPLAILAGLSATAAAVVLFYAADVWSTWQDPIAGLLNSMEMVLQ
jgi:hypothetical protein